MTSWSEPLPPSGVTLEALLERMKARGEGATLHLPHAGSLEGARDGVHAGSATTRRLTGVTQDSRKVAPGDLFLAWTGTRIDAHDFLGEARERGAGAALVERPVPEVALPQIQVRDARSSGARVAMDFAGNPASHLHVTAVTGTNGKTTTAVLARHLLGAAGGDGAGRPTAAMGTLGVVGPDGGVREGTGGLTTPGPVELASTLAGLVAEGVEALVLEASSHALEQRRLDGIVVQVAAFTNLTRDHLDYHGTMEAYLGAKARLLGLLSDDATVVCHAGDPAWSRLPPTKARVRAVGIDGEPAPGVPAWGRPLPRLVARELETSGTGSRFVLADEASGEAHPVHLPLLGRFNVENALVAAGIALAGGRSLAQVAEALHAAPAPPGRMELTLTEPVPVILDYAHTPDALARALDTLRPLYPGRVIVVFGAGGDRDRTKRPLMGRVAAAGAGLAIATSDNPRTEDPDRILDDVVTGMPASDEGAGWIRIRDRREAMTRALDEARPGDAILLAGKGHETVQVVGTEARPFDERKVLREILAERGAA